MSKDSLTQKRNQTRHDFLHTFFPEKEGYQTIEVNGYFLVNQWNATNGHWEVAIYTPESFRKMAEWKTKQGIERGASSTTPEASTPVMDETSLFPSNK